LAFLCVGVVGVFFELFVFFGGVLVVFVWELVEGGGFGVWSLLVVCMWLYCCLLSGAVLVWLLLFYWGVYYGYLRCFVSCLVVASLFVSCRR
jgi:hypothetical protein